MKSKIADLLAMFDDIASIGKVPLTKKESSFLKENIDESKQYVTVLKTVFGYDTFWPLQEKVIAHVLEKKDALVSCRQGAQIPLLSDPINNI